MDLASAYEALQMFQWASAPSGYTSVPKSVESVPLSTIRPGGYDGLAAHVHHVVTATGFKPRLCDLWFGDEPA